MGGIHSSNKFANFFDSGLDAIADGTAGAAEGFGDTLKGLTTGDFDYKNSKAAFQNSAGADLNDALYGGNSRVHVPLSAAQKLAKIETGIETAKAAAANPYDVWNKSNWQTQSRAAVGSVLGGHIAAGGRVPPSNIGAISNGDTKNAISQTRGEQRSNIMSANNVADAKLASTPALQQTPVTASRTIASAGGVGAPTSLDSNNQAYSSVK